MDGFVAIYIFMLAAFTGYEVISRVPVILHTPLMSGSNFVHRVVLVGGMIALGQAETPLQQAVASSPCCWARPMRRAVTWSFNACSPCSNRRRRSNGYQVAD